MRKKKTNCSENQGCVNVTRGSGMLEVKSICQHIRESQEEERKKILSGNYCAGVAFARALLCEHKERREQEDEGGIRDRWPAQ